MMWHEPIRLNKLLAQIGPYSRREVERLIAQGRIHANGQRIREPGFVIPDVSKAKIHVDGQRVEIRPARPVYLKFHKTSGSLTTRSDERHRRTIYEDLPFKWHHLDPIGRLDRKSSGLLLLTNDGNFHYQLSHPRFHVEKVYRVTLDKAITFADELIETLLNGVWFEPEQAMAKAVEVAQYDINELQLTLQTGYNRQVRRMLADSGYEVTRLKRVRFGPLSLQGLEPGAARELKPSELRALKFYLKAGGGDISQLPDPASLSKKRSYRR
jgi:23S rRNA pseudouridine2605 synthase